MSRSSRAPNTSRQRSNTSNNNSNNNNRRTANNTLPTLDLHGLRLEPAIRRVTDWLEEQQDSAPGFVRIITGSGSHSHHTGPVLRNAIQDLLMRRQMIFTMDRASFQVDPRSGMTLYGPPPAETDSKVIVVGTIVDEGDTNSGRSDTSNHSEPLVASMPVASCASLTRRHVSFSGVPANPGPSTLHRHSHQSQLPAQQPLPAQQQPAQPQPPPLPAQQQQQQQQPRSVSDSGPTRRTSASTIIATAWKNDANHNVQQPDELDPNDDQVALLHAREASLESARQELWHSHDHNALDRALQASQREYNDEMEHEENLVIQALQESQEQEAARAMAQKKQEEEMLKQVLEESQRAVVQKKRQEESEDRLLQQALRESERDVVNHEKDEEDALKEALSRSLQDVNQQPTVLSDEEEEQLIRQALEMSLRNP